MPVPIAQRALRNTRLYEPRWFTDRTSTDAAGLHSTCNGEADDSNKLLKARPPLYTETMFHGDNVALHGSRVASGTSGSWCDRCLRTSWSPPGHLAIPGAGTGFTLTPVASHNAQQT